MTYEQIFPTDRHGNPLGPSREEIVRCGDCKHAFKVTWPNHSKVPPDYLDCQGELVETWDYYADEPKCNPVPPDGFCFCGEPKGGESDAR